MRWQRLALAVCIGASATASCAGSSPADQCQTGSATAEGAVESLLQAAVGSDLQAACLVTTRLDDADLGAHLDEISAFVTEAGGSGALRVEEAEQLGRTWWVTVRAESSDLSFDLAAEELDGRWLVLAPPREADVDHTPSSDPNPPEP